MSFHVAPYLPDLRAGGVIALLAGDQSGADALPRPAGEERGDVLSVHLPHMGLVLAISQARAAGQTLVGLDSLLARPADHRRTLVDDRVVAQLSQALQSAEVDSAGGLHADALRLAIVARILTLDGQSHAPQVDEALPAPAPARVRPGLPKWRLKRVMAHVQERLCETVTLADMAAAAGLSRMHFAAQFRIATGLRPHEYLLKCRVERAQQLMRESTEPLVQIALSVGFQTQAHFTTVFRRFAGTTPHRWRSMQG
ncbi:helix-turn-helix protein [Azorhizobium sp. AG788]|uniref:helix-turn-helix domain-containing protein n=1 Tax=Azorhizobium sp. AG788 TaxID=2183897 RepID=UPI00105CA195|nr:AraC family transcriptional regulator [Azorhizobium sp. AG788]TDT99434.1 helix-turn-helix protein [Azorhizobium sp. AG788]